MGRFLPSLLLVASPALLPAQGAAAPVASVAPLDYRGVGLGEPFAPITAAEPVRIFCTPVRADDWMTAEYAPADSVCGVSWKPEKKGSIKVHIPKGPATYAGITIVHQQLFQWQGRFVGAELPFSAFDYAAMESALREKFGPPTRTAVEELQTEVGGRLEAPVLEWVRGDGAVRLSRVYGSAGSSVVRFTWAPFEAARAQARAAEGRRRTGDM